MGELSSLALANDLQAVDYSKQATRYFESSPMGTKNGRKAQDSDSDTDFQERDESEEEPESDAEGVEVIDSRELQSEVHRPRSVQGSLASSPKNMGTSLWLDVIHNSS